MVTRPAGAKHGRRDGSAMFLPLIGPRRGTSAARARQVGIPSLRLPGPAPVCRWRRFAGRSAELKQVRRWLAGLLPAGPACDDVMSIAVELATNAVRHTASGRGGHFLVEVNSCDHPGVLRISVTDGGAPQGPRWPTGPCPVEESGRGMYLVCALASRTGESGDARSRQVWAEVPWAGGGLDVSGSG
jgi:serine/threonine-protein kinase RsbW